MTQLALAFAPGMPFVDQLDEPFLYHDIQRPGFTAFLTPGGERRQTSVQLKLLPAYLAQMRSGPFDAYIAANEFFRPNRRAVHCWRLTTCFVDFDTYKLDHLYGEPAEALTDKLLRACEDARIPPPSVVVFSGRGLQAKWLFDKPVPRRAMPRWCLVQSILGDSLSSMGADLKALDASRVLRLVGSINHKSGELVRLTHCTRTPTLGGLVGSAGIVVYDFEQLADELMPLSREQLAQRRAEVAGLREQDVARELEARRRQAARESLILVPGGPRISMTAQRLIPSQLGWDRLADLRMLVSLRNGQLGTPSKQRNTFVFLGACFLASALVAPAFRAEVRELAQEFAPTWTNAEIDHCLSAVHRRVEAAAKGERVEFDGRQVDPRYRFGNKTLVDWLNISDDEMRHMRTILSETEARRRDADRKAAQRRAQGCATRDEYLQAASNKATQARALKRAGLSLSEIASQLDIGRSSASRYCAAAS